MHGAVAGMSVDKTGMSGIITGKEAKMKRKWVVFAVVFALIAAGCCPFSKKPITQQPKTEQPVAAVEQSTASQQPTTPAEEPPTAKPTEVATAAKGGEIPPTRIPEEEPLKFEPSSFESVYFDFDKYNIRADQQNKLKTLFDYLKNNPKVSILIEGHCDERGTDEYNLVLGEQRALSTRNFLIALGISPKRLYTISYGEEKPADSEHNEEAWAKNRRCEFKIKQ